MKCDCCGSDAWQPRFSENGFLLRACAECDLLSIDPMPAASARMTEIEQGHFAGGERVLGAAKQTVGERMKEAQFQSYVSLAKKFSPDGRWLDVGCGAGFLLALAKRAGYEIEGIELTGDRREAARVNTGAQVHGVPAEDVHFPDATFDVISMINVFSHLTSPAATFVELRRILKPGGILLCVTGEVGPGVKKSHVLGWNLGDHLYFLGDRTMARYASDTGFTISHHDRIWVPAATYTKERFRIPGRSPLRNAIKTGIAATPGAMQAVRSIMLRRQADSAAFSAVYVLTA